MPSAQCLRPNAQGPFYSFLLLIMVAGVLSIDLFESDVATDGHKALYRIELVFDADRPSQPPVLSGYEATPDSDRENDRILPQHFYTTSTRPVLSVIKKICQAPFVHSSHHTSSFNIPHQNSDEDEAFILPVDVA